MRQRSKTIGRFSHESSAYQGAARKSACYGVGGDLGMSEQKLALRVNWIQPPNTERWLRRMVVGSSLNVCCGMSRVGDVRIDTDPTTNRTVEGDLFAARDTFGYLSFDTVICDPPYDYYFGKNFGHFKWFLQLSDIAKKRLIISAPQIQLRLRKRDWHTELYSMRNFGAYLRLYWVFDRKNGTIQP